MERPILFNTEMVKAILDGRKTQTRRIIKPGYMVANHENGMPARVPPYEPGDILWVRETWNNTVYGGKFCYKADFFFKEAFPWKPSIHMPKEAARIFLRVTDVRCERLQDISEDDVFLEGYNGCPGAHAELPCWVGGEECNYGYWYCNHSLQEGFGRDVWDNTLKPNDVPKYGWDANPWVWVIKFERVNRFCYQTEIVETAERL